MKELVVQLLARIMVVQLLVEHMVIKQMTIVQMVVGQLVIKLIGSKQQSIELTGISPKIIIS